MARAPLVMPRGQRFGAPGAGMRARTVAVIVLAGLGLGLGSAWGVLIGNPPLGAVQLGPWSAWPKLGSAEIDPYSRAILARGPHLPVAAGEGLAFSAAVDSAGQGLTGRCRYRITGRMLPSRGWTLSVTDGAGRAVDGPSAGNRPSPWITDADMVTGEDGVVTIRVSHEVSEGVWLQVPAQGPFHLALRFYDTPLSASADSLGPGMMPAVIREACA